MKFPTYSGFDIYRKYSSEDVKLHPLIRRQWGEQLRICPNNWYRDIIQVAQVCYLARLNLESSPLKLAPVRGRAWVNSCLENKEPTEQQNTPSNVENTSVVMAAPATDVVTGAVAFHNEIIDTESYGRENMAPSRYLDDELDYVSNQYFSRYRYVGRIDNPVWHTWDVKDFFNDPQFKVRYQGAMGIRGTLKFKVTWNSDPMIQGLYVLAYFPPNVVEPTNAAALGITSKTWLMYFTGMPHVIINIARDSSAELVVPYVGETPYIPLYGSHTYAHQVGRLHLLPISALKSSTSPLKIYFNVYFALDDAKLFGTQPGEASVQAAYPFVEAMHKTQVYSTVAGKVSDWLDSFSESNPLVRLASWMIGGSGRIADFLGFSKPISVLPLQPVVHLSYSDTTTCDQTFTGAIMAVNSGAGVCSSHTGLPGVDDLSIGYITSRYEYFRTLNFTKSMEFGKVLGTFIVQPGDMFLSEHVDTEVEGGTFSADYKVFNHIGYLSTIFKKWRGGMKFKLVPSCTRFHSGRVRVVVYVNGTEQEALDRMSFAHTAIVDISDPSTWEFVVPYMAQIPWRDTRSVTLEERIGMSFYVENALIAPDNVADNIDLVLMVKGAEDLEFAEVDIPFDEKDPWFFNIVAAEAKVQSGDSLVMAAKTSGSVAAHSAAVGDPVRSLRPLLRRLWASFKPTAQHMFAMCAPFTWAKSSIARPDILSRISAMYTFYRGGMRYFCNSYYPLKASVTHSHIPKGPYANCATNVIGDIPQFEAAPVVAVSTVGEPLKIEVPYYQNTERTNLWTILANSDGTNYDDPRAKLGVYFNFLLGLIDGIIVQRAGADDFDLGFLIAAPPLATTKYTPKAEVFQSEPENYDFSSDGEDYEVWSD